MSNIKTSRRASLFCIRFCIAPFRGSVPARHAVWARPIFREVGRRHRSSLASAGLFSFTSALIVGHASPTPLAGALGTASGGDDPLRPLGHIVARRGGGVHTRASAEKNPILSRWLESEAQARPWAGCALIVEFMSGDRKCCRGRCAEENICKVEQH